MQLETDRTPKPVSTSSFSGSIAVDHVTSITPEAPQVCSVKVLFMKGLRVEGGLLVRHGLNLRENNVIGVDGECTNRK